MGEYNQWSEVIKPQNSLLSVNLKEIWRYRDLWMMFVKRDIVTQYKQTILGPLWFFVQPIITTIMYMVVFGGIAGIPTDGIPQPLFYLLGICLWQYFSDCLTKTSNTFISNSNIFGKVYFPRLIVPLSIVTSSFVRLGIQFLLFIVVYIYYALFTEVSLSPNLYLLLTPILLLILASLSLGFGVLFSSMTTKYRDLTFLLSFFVQLWMYATPIIYPLNTISNEKLRFIMTLNPITPIVETMKFGAFGGGAFSWWSIAYSFGFTALLLIFSVLIFNRVQRTFMDTV